MPPRKHAKLGASTAHRWMNCAGSVALIAEHGAPDTESAYALEGTVAHWVTEQVLLGETVKPGTVHRGVEVDEDMLEAARIVRDEVRRTVQLDGRSFVLPEQRFSLEELDPPGDMFGTSDVVIFAPAIARLVVIDLKYGKGVVVEVDDNPQLLYYALGALLQFEKDHPELRGRIREIEIVVVQPRAHHERGPVRSATVRYDELAAFATELLAAAERTTEPDAPLTPGSWCRFCSAAPVCPALKSHTTALAQVEFEAMPSELPPDPKTLPMEVLLDVMEKADIVEQWLKDVRAYIFGRLESGEVVPGWKLVAKRATRKWKDDETAAQALVKDYGLAAEEVFETKLRSPAQVEKIAKRTDVDLDEHFETLYEAKSSGFNLAPDSDPRPALPAGPDHDFGAPPSSS